MTQTFDSLRAVLEERLRFETLVADRSLLPVLADGEISRGQAPNGTAILIQNRRLHTDYVYRGSE